MNVIGKRFQCVSDEGTVALAEDTIRHQGANWRLLIVLTVALWVVSSCGGGTDNAAAIPVQAIPAQVTPVQPIPAQETPVPEIQRYSTPTITFDPYANVDWANDQRCLTQLHDHVERYTSIWKAYDNAGYCAVSFLNYSGDPSVTYDRDGPRWPPEDWLDSGLLANFKSIQLILPGAEQIGIRHMTSTFMESYIEAYTDYSNAQELVDVILERGGLPAMAHPWEGADKETHPNGLVMTEICSAFAYRNEYLGVGIPHSANMIEYWNDALDLGHRVFGICVNDWHGPGSLVQIPLPASVFNSGKIEVLVPTADLNRDILRTRMLEGAILAVSDRGDKKGAYPRIIDIVLTDIEIKINATDWTEIRWVSDGGEDVASGPDLLLNDLPIRVNWVRAEIENMDGSVVFTQAWEFFDDTSVELPFK